LEVIRQRAAELVHASPTEIAFIPNTTAGIGLIAEGLDWRPGDNVVTPCDEFPSNVYPWLNLARRGVETRRVAAAEGQNLEDALLQACDSRTRLISVSWVEFATGRRTRIETLAAEAHRRGVLVLLDAIQGLGVLPLDLQQTPIDFLAADGHKWLLGPEGAGLLYVRQESLDQLQPLQVGWNSVRQRFDFDSIHADWRPEAARYEGGSHNMPGLMALGASLEMLLDWGVGPADDRLARRVAAISDLATESLRSIGAKVLSDRSEDRKTGIVAFLPPGNEDPQEVRKRCLARNVVLSCRAGRLRISVHAYNNASDLERLTDVLQDSPDS
jgi:selenocysteine lyase/cysteine desulfurase